MIFAKVYLFCKNSKQSRGWLYLNLSLYGSMKDEKNKNNLWFPVFRGIFGFFQTLFSSLKQLFASLFFRGPHQIQENHFLETLHFILHDFPKKFWKKPTGIGLGRSFGEMILFFFKKESAFESTLNTPIKKISNQTPTSQKGFSLIEILISVTLLSWLLIVWFSAFGDLWKLKNKIVVGMDTYEQLSMSTDLFFTTLKQSGTIDYEEYFNRSTLGLTLSDWHYIIPSGFWNYGSGGIIGSDVFWSGAYLCRSGSGITMADAGCFLSGSLNTAGIAQTGIMQRYGSYQSQFMDYNSDASPDSAGGSVGPGDQNADGNITGDDDDEDLWKGPAAFSGIVHELYLIKKTSTRTERNIFRLRVERDPDAPLFMDCDVDSWTGSGCIGRLEMLQLVGRDYGSSHGLPVFATGAVFDGKIDTWECADGYYCSLPSGVSWHYLPTGTDSEWVSLLWPDINVQSLEFQPAPTTDISLAWKDPNAVAQNAHVRIKMQVWYGWKKKKILSGKIPTVTITTMVNLYK